MIPAGPDPGQRARDGRLAWIIVGCSALVTLLLLAAGLWALRAPLARGAAALAAAGENGASENQAADDGTATDAPHELGKAPVDADTRRAEPSASRRSAGAGEVHKGDTGSSDEGAGTHDDDDAQDRSRGPVA